MKNSHEFRNHLSNIALRDTNPDPGFLREELFIGLSYNSGDGPWSTTRGART